MLLTQAKAVEQLRTRTGLSLEGCRERVRAMPKILDRSREKINITNLEQAIADILRPPVHAVSGVRPLSTRHRQMVSSR